MDAEKRALLGVVSALISGDLSPRAVIPGQWPEIVELALLHGVGPMLLWSLSRAGMDTAPDVSWVAPLKGHSRLVAVNHIRLKTAQWEAHKALSEAGIPALWLKGIALASTVYPEPALRPMGDLDVLIPYAQRERALEVVTSLEYVPGTWGAAVLTFNDAVDAQLDHHYHLHSHRLKVILELHFQFAKALLPLNQMDWFWEQAQPLDGEDSLAILKPAAHLLYLCAHTTLQHGEAEFRLLRYLDLHLLITHSDMDWDVVVTQAVVLGWTYAVERALSMATFFFSTPVPELVLMQLRQDRPVHEDVSYAMSLQGTGARWARVRKRLGSLSFRERIHFIRTVVFPSRTYVRHRYSDRFGEFIALYYIYRWFDQGREVFHWALKRVGLEKRGNGYTKLP